MRKLTYLLPFFAFVALLLSNTLADGGNSTDARINTYKYECKQMIKPARYEGSRITYYTASKENQKKSVEAFLLLDTEYKFAFSGKECSSKVSVRFYDSEDESKRTLLKEIKNITGKNTLVSSLELSKVYRSKVNDKDRLKVVYIEYQIAGGNTKNEAIVMVVGYKD